MNLCSHPLCHPRPYVELMNFLLKCGDEMRAWVGRRLQGQCKQHWGALCGSFANICPLNQSDDLDDTTPLPAVAAAAPPLQPTREVELETKRPVSLTDSSADFIRSVSERPFISDS